LLDLTDEPYGRASGRWIKRKNPEWPRYEPEREAAIRDRPHRTRAAL
jgi:hypothetical protein